MKQLEAAVHIRTPVMGAGAEQSKAELRAQSFKGVLRFWLRAADPHFRRNEPALMGATAGNAGAAKMRLHLDLSTSLRTNWTFRRDAYHGFDIRHGPSATHVYNGFSYCAYPFDMRGGRRPGVEPGQEFRLHLGLAPTATDAQCDQAAAALWLALNLGGIGARSRRGFGSMELTEMACEDFEPSFRLRLLADSATPEAWFQQLADQLADIRSLFGGFATGAHPHLDGARIKLLPLAHNDWEAALNAGGLALQTFRQRRAPDYGTVKAHLCAVQRDASCAGVAPARMQLGPERAAFGLPLAFRFSSVTRQITRRDGHTEEVAVSMTLVGLDGERIVERSGSPIHFRVVRIGEQFHPLFIWLPADLLPAAAELADRERYHPGHAPGQRTPHTFSCPGEGILCDFWKSLKTSFAWSAP